MKNKNKQFRSSYRGPKNRRKSSNVNKIIVLTAGVILVLGAVSAAALLRKGTSAEKPEPSSEIAVETEKKMRITVNGKSLDGMSREQAKQEIISWYPWNMQAAFGDETAPLDNPLESVIDGFVDEIFEAGDGEYTLEFDGLEEAAAKVSAAYAQQWDIKSKNSMLDHYDKETGKFVFSEGCSGTAVNQEKLSRDIVSAVKAEKYDAVIDVELRKVSPELSMEEAKNLYKTLATFTTETTNNAKRNTNVRLAAEALNGTIVQPGEEFSFNAVVGQRTAEKGYQDAAAYNSGEVVQEIGGGVCQMSSTLYRVVFQSGMKITYRRSHTFEPNYVTPGQDAAISWGLPDFRFINESEGPIGIRASYADRKATVSIFGIPVLEDGVKWDLYSEKTEDMDIPEPVYVEDNTLPPGTEKIEKAGSQGSRWVTYKVVTKDGKEVERIEDHSKTYKGHAPVIRRNTSSVMETSAETAGTAPSGTSVPSETSVPATGGQQEGGQTGANQTGNNPSGTGQPETSHSGSSQTGGNQSETPVGAGEPAPTENGQEIETIAPFIY